MNSISEIDLYKRQNFVVGNKISYNSIFISILIILFVTIILFMINYFIKISNMIDKLKIDIEKQENNFTSLNNKLLKQIDIMSELQTDIMERIDNQDKQNNVYRSQIQNINKQNDTLTQYSSILFDTTKKQDSQIKKLDNIIYPILNYYQNNEYVIVGKLDSNFPLIFNKYINNINSNTLPSNNNYGYLLLNCLKCTNIKSIYLYNLLNFGYKYDDNCSRFSFNSGITHLFTYREVADIKEIQKLYNYIQDMGIEIEFPESDKVLLFSLN